MLVLIDFEKKPVNSRPDFYVLTSCDWAQIIDARCVQPGHVKSGKVTISESNVPNWSDGFVGMGVKSSDVQAYKEK